jgi:hypothetical protein
VTISTVVGIFAVIGFREFRWFALLAPDLVASSSGVLLEERVAFFEVSIYCNFGVVQRLVIAVMDNGAGHAAKNGLNYI